MDKLSQLLGGVPIDHLKLSFSIFFTYPCAILFHYLKPNSKHLFSIIYSTFILIIVLKLYDGFIHIITIGFISFLFMKYYKGKQAAWINFTFVMISMSLCHIGRQLKGFEGDTKLDYSGALMIITIKLSSFGFNVMDKYSNNNNNQHTEEMKIITFPNLLEYFGWLFYFAGFLAGPSCEYMHYLNSVNQTSPPFTLLWRPALKTCSKSLLFMIILILFSAKFNYFEALKPNWSLHSFWYKMLFIQLSAVLTRCKYYFIWYLSEGACILSGFGFNGYDKDKKIPLWNKLSNVNVLSCEFAQSYKMLTENWNIGANHWLRHYVYLRFNPPGTASTTLKTYIISSLWHGFHPGFYLFFMISSSLQVLSRQIRKTLRPFFIQNVYSKLFYDVCTWIVSMGILNMLVPCFDLLHIPKIMHVWREIYYCHFILIFIGSVTYFGLKPYLLSIQKENIVDNLSIKKIN